MTIKIKLKLGFLAMLGLPLLIGILFYSMSRETGCSTRKKAAALRIIAGTYELNMVIHGYAASRTEAGRVQALSRQASLEDLLEEDQFASAGEKEIFQRLLSNKESMKRLMDQMLINTAGMTSNEWLLARSRGTTLEMVNDARQLYALSEKEVQSAHKRFAVMALSLIVLSLIVLGIVANFLYKGVAGSLEELRRGTERLAAGDLAHRVDIESKDEMGMLADAFNRMAGEIKSSYAALEREVEERKRAEEALLRLKGELESRVEERTASLKLALEDLRRSELKYRIVMEHSYHIGYWLDPEGDFVYISPSCKRITGCAFEEFLDDPSLMRKIVHSEDLAIFDRHRQEEDDDSNKINPRELQFRIVHSDGTIRWIGHVCRRVFDEEGRYLGIRATNRDMTEQKEAQDALRESEKRFSDLFHHAPSAMVLARLPEGIIEDVNQAWVEMYGYSREEAVGKTTLDLGMKRDPEGRKRLLAEVQQRGFVRNREATFYTKSGSPRVIHSNTDAITLRGKKYLISAMLDITERKRTEARLEADLAALSRIHALSGKLLGSGGTQLLLQELMDESVAIVKAEKGTLQLLEGGSLRIVAHHGHQPPFLDSFAGAEERASVGGVALKRGERVVVPDVEASPMFACAPSLAILREAGVRAVQSTPMISRTGALLGVLTTHWGVPYTPDEHDLWRIDLLARQAADLIEHSRAEEALRESEEKFRTFFHTSPSIMVISSLEEGCVIDANQAFEKAMGYSLKEILERPSIDVGIWTNFEERRRLAEVLMAQGDVRNVEIVLRTKSGELKTLLLSAEKIALNGAPCVFSACLDITERKHMEEALREMNESLELRVKERTVELERKNQELQEFAFVASHDLSEPLRKIQAFGDLLVKRGAGLLGDQERDFISRMNGAAKRMQELLDALLRYSRVDTKGQEFRPAKLDDIVREAVSDLEVTIGKLGARVEIGPLPSVIGDPLQLRQLVQNLIANSLKYYRSEVKPFVSIYGEENHGVCRIFVEDHGIGFDEKYLDKIFQPFQRLHGRNEYSGLGMGLAICRKIVERHHGTITAKSTPGKGSTFIVTLPA